MKLSYNQDTNLKNEFIKHHTTRIHDSAGLTSHIWRLCYVLTFYSIQGSKTEQLKITIGIKGCVLSRREFQI